MPGIGNDGTSLVEWLAATGALLPVVVGLATLAVVPWRRPSLSLHVVPEHSHAEEDPTGSPLPYLRLLARNGRLHRASHGTRVLVEYVQPVGGERRYVGSPPLGWTSAADSVDVSVVIFPGGERSVDLGVFDSYLSTDEPKDQWCLALVPWLSLHEGRHILLARPEGWVIRVVIGSDDGRARRYDVRVTWDRTKRLIETERGRREWNASEVLASVECKLTGVGR